MGVLNVYDMMLAHNVPVYIATRKWHVLKVTLQVATLGAESAVYDCLVSTCTTLGHKNLVDVSFSFRIASVFMSYRLH